MISKVCVIGSGVMGSGIAAQVANAGFPALLLDIVPAGAADRNVLAKSAIEKLLKSEPAPLMSKSAAALIEAGNIEDDLQRLGECDWIIEAVIEKPELKQALYKKIDSARKPGSILSSNTSTLPLKMLMDGMPESMQQDFCITHFFNPPRYMRLLEVVAGAETRPDAISAVSAFADEKLGKAVVKCHDTPGFIANRIGIYWIQCAVNAAQQLGLSVEEADAVMGKPIGAPKSGVFDLLDIIGLDLMPHVDGSMRHALPNSDAYHALPLEFPLLAQMIAEGRTGRKGSAGFYRLNKSAGGKIKEVVDLMTGAYRPVSKVALESVDAAKGGLRALIVHPDRGGRFAWTVLSKMLAYAAALVPEIAESVSDVDLAMRTGFNWKRGPFEMIDQLGAQWFAEKLAAEKIPVPPLLAIAAKMGGFYKTETDGRAQLTIDGAYKPVPQPAGSLLLADIKLRNKPLAKNASASVWDLGDGVACLEFHSKMNSIDPDTLQMAARAIEIVAKGMKALVIYNDSENFSVGANIGLALFAANIGMWPVLEELVTQGQNVMKALKFAPFPVVAAPSGMALGGGCEFVLHCSGVQAHAETYMGLVEVGVGIVPGWGGCKEMLIRQNNGAGVPRGPMPGVLAAFEQISLAKVSKSAANAKELKYMRMVEGITMNRDRLLADAKALALQLARDYKPPQPVELRLPGATGKAALSMAIQSYAQQGLALPHDVTVSNQLANVLSGGATDATNTISEDRVMELERHAFMTLVKTEPTLLRIEAMLATGKPLRN
jgi:3-hydroxyacyl-CoA dehydrogenase